MLDDGDAAAVVPQAHDFLRPDGLQVAEDGRQRRVVRRGARGGGGGRRRRPGEAKAVGLYQVQGGRMRRWKNGYILLRNIHKLSLQRRGGSRNCRGICI